MNIKWLNFFEKVIKITHNIPKSKKSGEIIAYFSK